MLEAFRSLGNNLFYLPRRTKDSDGKEKNT